jgi:hypothetical protein
MPFALRPVGRRRRLKRVARSGAIAIQQKHDAPDARARRRYEARELHDIAEALLAEDDQRARERRAVPDRNLRQRGSGFAASVRTTLERPPSRSVIAARQQRRRDAELRVGAGIGRRQLQCSSERELGTGMVPCPVAHRAQRLPRRRLRRIGCRDRLERADRAGQVPAQGLRERAPATHRRVGLRAKHALEHGNAHPVTALLH